MFPKKLFWSVSAFIFAASAWAGNGLQPSEVQPAVSLNSLPAVFIENKGQWDSHAKFRAQGNGLDLWITDQGPVYDFHTLPDRKGRISKGQVVRVGITGDASKGPIGLTELSGKLNYFIGNDRSKWISGVRRFQGVTTEPGANGVSVRYYSDHGSPRYDLVLGPGADLTKVAMRIEGADGIGVKDNGNLVIRTSIGDVEERGLAAYQIEGGRRSEVACRMVSHGDTVGFDVGAYDASQPLVIDPVVFATYLTDPSTLVTAVASDSDGNLYCGVVSSDTTYPVIHGSYGDAETATTCLVCELNSTGTKLIYGTYLGSGSTPAYPTTYLPTVYNVGLDNKNDLYVEGYDAGYEFPQVGPEPTDPYFGRAYPSENTPGAPPPQQWYFLTKLDPTGKSIIYSQLLGVAAIGLQIDPAGDAYFCGYWDGCPTTEGAYMTSPPYTMTGTEHHYDLYNAMVVKLNPAGDQILYSTYLPMQKVGTFAGVSNVLFGHGLGVDDAGEVAISGPALAGFPTTANAEIATAPNGGVVVAKLNSNFSALVFATYVYAFPAPLNNAGNNGLQLLVAENPAGEVAACGADAADPIPFYALKFTPTGSVMVKNDSSWPPIQDMYDLQLDAEGCIYGVGWAGPGIATTPDALEPAVLSGRTGADYIFKRTPSGADNIFSSYIGDEQEIGTEQGFGPGVENLIIRPGGSVVVAGANDWNLQPTTGAFQTSPGNASIAAFTVKKLGLALKILGAETSAGGKTLAEVTIGYAPTKPMTVLLSSSASVVGVPKSVIIPAGTTGVQFWINTDAVASPITVNVTANEYGNLANATLVLQAAKLTALSLNPTAVIGGLQSQGTVTLAAPAASFGVPVILTSSSPIVLPKFVTVPGGAATFSFAVGTSGVSVETNCKVEASFGSTAYTASINVVPSPLANVIADPSPVLGGQSTKVTVNLIGKAGPQGTAVAMAESGALTIPSSATVPANATSTSFVVGTKPVSSTTVVKFTATLSGASRSGSLTIEPAGIKTFTISQTSIRGGNSTIATIQLTDVTGPLGATISISGGGVIIPSTVSVGAGGSGATFPIKTPAVDGPTTVTITATLGSSSMHATLTIQPASLTVFNLSPYTVTGGNAGKGFVYLDGPAGPSGVVVGITTAGSVVSTPHYVVIAAGQSSTSFAITTQKVTTQAKVAINVFAGSATLTQTLTVDP